MSNAMSLRVPKTLFEQVKAKAKEEGISANQFVLLAVAEKMAREQALELLDHRFEELNHFLFVDMLGIEENPNYTRRGRKYARR